jgi:hypothetical protein
MKQNNNNEKIIKTVEEAFLIVTKANIDPALRPIAYNEVLKYLLQAMNQGIAKESIQQVPPKIALGYSHIESFGNFEEYRVTLRDKIKTNPEKLLAVVYWLKLKEKKECVTNEDIKEILKNDPEWSVPGNLPRDLKQAQKEGWLTKPKEGCWDITNMGKKKMTEYLSQESE